jgi:hypothetical protein
MRPSYGALTGENLNLTGREAGKETEKERVSGT